MKWLKKLFNDEEQKKMNSRLVGLEKNYKNIYDKLESTNRILKYAEKGKVTHYSHSYKYLFCEVHITYFYKDFCEYTIYNLKLYDAKIIDGNLMNDIIQVIDSYDENIIEYLVNLKDCTFMRVK